MGAILAVFGELGHDERLARCQAMCAVSPYRGVLERVEQDGVLLAVQTHPYTALSANADWAVAVHGVVGTWGEYAARLTGGDDLNPARAIRDLLAEVSIDALFRALAGQFSCIIHDRRQGSVQAVRDLGGTRPLYYGQSAGVVALATEARQVLAGLGGQRRLDELLAAQLAGFASRSLTPERTLYQGVLRVLPAACACWQRGGLQPALRDYWTPAFMPPLPRSGQQLAAEVRDVVCEAVRRSVPSGTDYAVSLSGGLDSSAIWACVRQLERAGAMPAGRRSAISLVFPGMACDESPLIETNLAEGDAWLQVDASACRLSSELDTLVAGTDLIHGGLTVGYGPYFQQLAGRGIGVELSGHGADDLFHEGYGFLPAMLWRGELRRWWQYLRRYAQGVDRPASPAAALGWLAGATVPRDGMAYRLLRRLRRRNRFDLLADRWADLADRRQDMQLQLAQEVDPRMLGRAYAWQGLRNGFVVDAQEMYYAQRGIDWRFPFLDGRVIQHLLALSGPELHPGPEYKSLQRQSFSPLLPARVAQGGIAYYTDFYAKDLGWRADTIRMSDWQLFARGILDYDRFKAWQGRDEQAAHAEIASWYYPLERMLRSFSA